MNETYSPGDAAVDERPLVDQPLPEAPATARLMNAGGQMVQAVASGMAEVTGNIVGTIAGALAAPLTAAAATAHEDAPEAEEEAQQRDTQASASEADGAAESQGAVADGSAD